MVDDEVRRFRELRSDVIDAAVTVNEQIDVLSGTAAVYRQTVDQDRSADEIRTAAYRVGESLMAMKEPYNGFQDAYETFVEYEITHRFDSEGRATQEQDRIRERMTSLFYGIMETEEDAPVTMYEAYKAADDRHPPIQLHEYRDNVAAVDDEDDAVMLLDAFYEDCMADADAIPWAYRV